MREGWITFVSLLLLWLELFHDRCFSFLQLLEVRRFCILGINNIQTQKYHQILKTEEKHRFKKTPCRVGEVVQTLWGDQEQAQHFRWETKLDRIKFPNHDSLPYTSTGTNSLQGDRAASMQSFDVQDLNETPGILSGWGQKYRSPLKLALICLYSCQQRLTLLMEKKEPFENSLKADQAIPWGENILWINYNQTIDEDALGKRQNLVLAKDEKLMKSTLQTWTSHSP